MVRYRGRMKGHGQPGIQCTRTFWVTFLTSVVCVCLMLCVVFLPSNQRVAMGLLAAAVTVTVLSVLKLIQEKIVECMKRNRRDAGVQTSEELEADVDDGSDREPVPV